MSSNRTPEERVQLGLAAKTIQDNGAFQLAHHEASSNAVVDFANSAVGERDERELAWAKIQGIQAVLDVLERFVQDGVKVSRETPQAPEKTGPQEKN